MKTVLVTGASGYIGPHVISNLLNKNCRVFGVSRSLSQQVEGCSYIEKDIFDESVDFFQLAKHPEVCIHLAWKDGFSHNSPNHILYLSQHFRFLKDLIDKGLKSLVVLGTMHEVGYWEGSISEDTPCNPTTLYGIAKNALKDALITYCKDKGCSLKWLRAYYILGDEKRANNIFAKILQAEQLDKKEFPFTTGTNLYDFINVDELAEQISTCSLQNEIGGVIECCSGKPQKLADAVEQFIAQNNLKIKLKYGAFPDRDYDSPGIWGDNSKLLKILKEK